MSKKVTIKWRGEDSTGEDIDFKVIKEDWNRYELEDGSIIKVKLIASNFVKLNNEFDEDGNPLYVLKSSNVMIIEPRKP
jgi:hypothetical protein